MATITRDSEEKISKKLNNLRREFQKIKEEVQSFNHTSATLGTQ
jgi:hypothetical protein